MILSSILQVRVRQSLLCAIVLVVCSVLGCGADEYERRLGETTRYYNELDRIELNLAPKWGDGRVVEYIRVPKQFQLIPAPTPVKNEDGKEEMPAVDPRQPDFLNLVFPSHLLVAAWEAPFDVPVEGNIESRKGYIYLLSNYWQFVGEDSGEALKFTGAMIQLIGNALEEQLPAEKLESPDTKKCPKPGSYLPSNLYSLFEFKPKPITLNETSVQYTFTAYARQNGNILCMVLVALPESVSPKEKLSERIDMMLGQFAFTRTEPRAGQSANTPAAAPGPAGF